ncbi:MAG: crossover junction endodeoxyribonuclease RuvC [Archangium sp.]|nr:crossover junction endodeoxyribonuclease RuvC [Archangium sp.]
MRVLGIDPGSRYLGFGIVDVRRGVPVYAAHGVVKAAGAGTLAERLKLIFDELQQVVHVFQPEAVAVEGVFTHKNARSALILGHARGVALLLAAKAGLPVHEYAPARVKRSVGAGGNDSKDAVARMVTTLLKLKEPLERADAYDALAVALCHAHQLRGIPVKKASTTTSSFSSRLAPSYVAPVGALP